MPSKTNGFSIGDRVKFESEDFKVEFSITEIKLCDEDGEIYYSHEDLDAQYPADELELVE